MLSESPDLFGFFQKSFHGVSILNISGVTMPIAENYYINKINELWSWIWFGTELEKNRA